MLDISHGDEKFTCGKCGQDKSVDATQPEDQNLGPGKGVVPVCRACRSQMTKTVIQHIVKNSLP